MRMSGLSTEYVKVPVTADVDPTSDVVMMALTLAAGGVSLGDFTTASWETTDGVHYARLLVGPAGGLALPNGSYKIWVKITDNPEIPVKPAGHLTIYGSPTLPTPTPLAYVQHVNGRSGDVTGLVETTDSRLSDQRVPTALSVTDAKVATGAGIAESKLALLHGQSSLANVAQYGIKIDGRINLNGAMSTGSAVLDVTGVASYNPGFLAGRDEGKVVNVGLGASILASTIASVQSTTRCTLADAAPYDLPGPRTLTDVSTTASSQQIGSATAGWNAGSVGRTITITGANIGGAGVNTLTGEILSVQSSTLATIGKFAQATLSALSATVTGTEVVWGTDDTVAVKALMMSSTTDYRHLGYTGLKFGVGICLLAATVTYVNGCHLIGGGDSYFPQISPGTQFRAIKAPGGTFTGSYVFDTDAPVFDGQHYNHGNRFEDFSIDGSQIAGLTGLRIFQSGEAASWRRLYAQRCPGAGIMPTGAHATLHGSDWSVFNNGVGADFTDCSGPVTVDHISGDNNGQLVRVRNYVTGPGAYYNGTGLQMVLTNPKAETQTAGRNEPVILVDQCDQGSILVISGSANNEVLGNTAADFVKIAALTTAAGAAKVHLVHPTAQAYTNFVNNVPTNRITRVSDAGLHPEVVAGSSKVVNAGKDYYSTGTALGVLYPNGVHNDVLVFLTTNQIALRSGISGLRLQTSLADDIMTTAQGSPESLDCTWYGNQIPSANAAVDLGASGTAYRDLFVSRTAAMPGLRFRGAWASTTAYVAGDVVVFGGIPQIATSSFTSGSSFNAANWTPWGMAPPPWGVGVLDDPSSPRSTDAGAIAAAGNPTIYYRLKHGGTATKARFKVIANPGSTSLEVSLHTNTGTGDTAYPGAKLGGTGSITAPAVGDADVSFTGSVSWNPGDWLGIGCSATTVTLLALLGSAVVSTLGKGRCWIDSTAYPIPSNPSATPSNLSGLIGRMLDIRLIP